MKERWILVSISALTVILTVLAYQFWDIPLLQYCRSLPPEIISWAEVITKFGITTGYLIVSFLLFLFFRLVYKNYRYAAQSLFVFLSLSITGIVITLVKWVAGRHRPIDLFKTGRFGFDYFGQVYELLSFPSGHTQTIFTLATALTALFPRWGIPLFSLATAVGVSRIVLTSHYLSDVIAGAGIGIIGTRIIKYYFDRYFFNRDKMEDDQGFVS